VRIPFSSRPWAPPRVRPGRDKLREELWRIFDDPRGFAWFQDEVQLPRGAIGCFLDGDDAALTYEQTMAAAAFCARVGWDMRTNGLIRRR
jgi:hypothetical protein